MFVAEILYRLGILKFIPYDKLPRKAVIVASETDYLQTADRLQKVHYAPELSGRISADDNNSNHALASLKEMKQFLFTANVNEVIFCIKGLSYMQVFKQMQLCGSEYEYKIHLPGSQSFVGSNSSSTSGDLYTIDRSYNLSDFAQLRNKRIVDIACSIVFLVLYPIIAINIKKPGTFLATIFKVIFGKMTWVGYSPLNTNIYLPKLRPGAIRPYNILTDYEPVNEVKMQINIAYAQHYNPMTDINLLLKNYKYLGGL